MAYQLFHLTVFRSGYHATPTHDIVPWHALSTKPLNIQELLLAHIAFVRPFGMLAYSGIVCTILEYTFLQIDVRSMVIDVHRQYCLVTAIL